MSEQLSMPAGGGLLTLNLSVLPQGATPVGSGSGLFGNFSAMLSQQGEQTPESGLLKNGAFLPQSGMTLPSSFESKEVSPEAVMRQQMLYVAQMLEQRTEGSEKLPPEISSELIQALKQYAERQPLLPEEGEVLSGGEDVPDKDFSELSEIVSDADERFTAGVVGAPILLPVNEEEQSLRDSEGRPLRTEGAGPLSDLQKLATLVSNLQRSELSSDELSKQTGLGSVGTHVETVSVDKGIVSENAMAANRIVQDASVTVAPVDPKATVERPIVESVSRTPEVAPAAPKVATDSATDPAIVVNSAAVAGEKQKPPAAMVTSVLPDSDNSDIDAPSRKVPPAQDVFQTKGANRNELPVESNAKEPISSPVMKSDGLLKPMTESSVSEKLGNALELTQQLMQKVASSEKTVDSGFNQRMEALSSVQQPQTITQPTQTQKAVSDAQNLMMPQNVQVNTPAWKNALGERAIMISAQNMNVANIQLDPPELGSLSIRVNVNQDQVSLSFTSPHAHVRDAVEQSLPRLREMFAEQGLALEDSSVADQSADQQRRDQMAEQGGGSSQNGQYGGDDHGDTGETVAEGEAQSISLVDYYA
jgi:flagellar hook-length control protein FliK